LRYPQPDPSQAAIGRCTPGGYWSRPPTGLARTLRFAGDIYRADNGVGLCVTGLPRKLPKRASTVHLLAATSSARRARRERYRHRPRILD
jgi:hypothetical protein